MLFRALIEPIKIFNWSNTNELYINLNASISNQKFLTGDEKGRIWIYKVFYFFKASEIMTHFSLILMVPKCKMQWIWFLFQQSIVKMVFLNWNKPFWMTSSCRLMVDSLLLVPTTIWCWSSNRQAKISFSRFCLILWFFFHHCAFFQICHYRAFLP